MKWLAIASLALNAILALWLYFALSDRPDSNVTTDAKQKAVVEVVDDSNSEIDDIVSSTDAGTERSDALWDRIRRAACE